MELNNLYAEANSAIQSLEARPKEAQREFFETNNEYHRELCGLRSALLGENEENILQAQKELEILRQRLESARIKKDAFVDSGSVQELVAQSPDLDAHKTARRFYDEGLPALEKMNERILTILEIELPEAKNNYINTMESLKTAANEAYSVAAKLRKIGRYLPDTTPARPHKIGPLINFGIDESEIRAVVGKWPLWIENI